MELWKSPLWSIMEGSDAWVSWDESTMCCQGGSSEVGAYLWMLRNEGFVVEQDPSHGWRIVSRPDRLFPPWISSGLGTRTFGKRLVYAHTMDSTQWEAVHQLHEGASEGTVVLCEYQRSGRGQRGRTWYSPACTNILMSLVVDAARSTRGSFTWTQIASLAVSDAIAPYTHSCLQIKWPNDVYLEGRKLCGILAECEIVPGRGVFAVVGIGLNVHSRPPNEPAAVCLGEVAAHLPGRVRLVQEILRRFEEWCQTYRYQGLEAIWEAWMRRSWLLGREVSIQAAGERIKGRVEGFLPDGRLRLVDETGGARLFTSGEIQVLSPEYSSDTAAPKMPGR